jgi:ABC-type Fe3+ transport system permease subunit
MNESQDYLNQNKNYNYNQQINLPNSTASLVLGIISIVTSICYATALIGIICGIIGLVLGNKDRAAYQSSPESYALSSHNQSNAGRTCSIIGVILAGLWILFLLIMLIFVGSMSLNDWNGLKR